MFEYAHPFRLHKNHISSFQLLNNNDIYSTVTKTAKNKKVSIIVFSFIGFMIWILFFIRQHAPESFTQYSLWSPKSSFSDDSNLFFIF